jgi:hypothetical protein
MTDTSSSTPRRLMRGLKKFDPAKHARFKHARLYGFEWPAAVYPIDRSARNIIGVDGYGMDGNGPDSPDYTANGGNPVGDCGVAAVPAHANMITAAEAALDLAGNTLSSNQTVTLYFIYQAQLAGVAWRPPAVGKEWSQDDLEQAQQLDLGVDLGDWLLWLFSHDIAGAPAAPGEGNIEGFLVLNHDEADAALSLGFGVVSGVNLNPQADAQVENGQIWDIGAGDEPDPDDGHAILYVVAESASGPNGWITWGQYQPSSYQWRQKCPQQWFAVLTKELAEAAGFPYAQLVSDLFAAGGTVAPVPVPVNPAPHAPPPPVDPPPPAPTPVPPNPAPHVPPPAPEPVPPVPIPKPTPPVPAPPAPPDPPAVPPENASWWRSLVNWLRALVEFEVDRSVKKHLDAQYGKDAQ